MHTICFVYRWGANNSHVMRGSTRWRVGCVYRAVRVMMNITVDVYTAEHVLLSHLFIVIFISITANETVSSIIWSLRLLRLTLAWRLNGKGSILKGGTTTKYGSLVILFNWKVNDFILYLLGHAFEGLARQSTGGVGCCSYKYVYALRSVQISVNQPKHGVLRPMKG